VFALFTNESNALNGGPGNHYGNQLWHIQSMDSDGGGGVVRDPVGRNVFEFVLPISDRPSVLNSL
jgi:hypothetical protein